MTSPLTTDRRSSRYLPSILLIIVVVALVVSGIRPYDQFTWVLEVAPILIMAPILIGTYRRFPLTDLLYVLLFIHAFILMIGGHYTYAKVPFGFWLQDWFDFSRNHYDRIGHFAQGFIPAILAREILLRCSPLRPGFLLSLFVVSVCLAFSAFYELIEWGAALATGEAANEFLGTQGDPWDTQSDMFFALVGALAALIMLKGIHDRALVRLSAISTQ